MKALLNIESNFYKKLTSHLLVEKNSTEQAAFLFVNNSRKNNQMVFEVIDSFIPNKNDFAIQECDYLELTDAARSGLIKRAHDLNASIVEMHSHLGPWPAAFSLSDRSGLIETVPHMWWRLKSRPYIAIVVTKNDYDALVWIDDPNIPQSLDGIVIGNQIHKPTNNSLKGWQ